MITLAKKLGRKLPKRASNDRLKNRRAKSHANGEVRKKIRDEENAQRAAENNKIMYVLVGTSDAYQMTKTARRKLLAKQKQRQEQKQEQK